MFERTRFFRATKHPEISYLSVLLLAVVVTGCSQEKVRTGYVEVYGTVTLDGDPLPNAQVIFQTADGSSFARTDADGKYVAKYNRASAGAGTGPATVRITTTELFPDEDVSDLKIDPRSGDYVKPEKVPEKYNRKSVLKIEIEEGGSPYDFELENS
jgi:hypothetical protein